MSDLAAQAPEPKNPVTYAEQILGVHLPWQEAQQRLLAHAAAQERVIEGRQKLRSLKDSIEDLRRELANQATTMYPNESITSLRTKTKAFISVHPDMLQLEDELLLVQTELDRADADVKHHELGLHVLTARMSELGGLLHFYAETKRAIVQASIQEGKVPA